MCLEVIGLVGHHQNRFTATTQDIRHFLIQIRQTVYHIDNKQDDIRFFNSDFHLLIDFFLKNILRVDNPSTGIHQRKLFCQPFDLAILAVACCPGLFIYDSLTCLRQTIEQGGLSYVGPTNNCYKISHILSLLSF